jgi:hypothetical protein
MSHDQDDQTRHLGRTAGMSTRDRLLLVAGVGLILGAILLSTVLGDGPTTFPTPGPSQLAILPRASPSPTTPPEPSEAPSATQESECGALPDGTPAWIRHPCEHRGKNGQRFEYDCPAGGSPGPIWGDVLYTDDSSVCGAGIHAGVLSAADGGTVTIVIRPARGFYIGVTRNGVTSESWGAWGGSFEVLGTGPIAPG